MSIKRTGWASTDELERAIREERAREVSMDVHKLRMHSENSFLIQGQDTGDAPDRTSAFLSLCREKLGA